VSKKLDPTPSPRKFKTIPKNVAEAACLNNGPARNGKREKGMGMKRGERESPKTSLAADVHRLLAADSLILGLLSFISRLRNRNSGTSASFPSHQ
jgi:hypothetical protein